jgi:hypothetical protein
MQSTIHVYGVLAIAQAPGYVPGGAGSFWKLIVSLVEVIGLWLIWVVLQWIVKKLAAVFRRK